MLSTPHILVGSAIVKIIPNPFISLPLAFLSHFLFDLAPHWDFKIAFKPKPLLYALIDYSLGLTIIFWITLADTDQFIILLGGVSATLPDFMMAGWKVLNIKLLNVFPLNVLNNFHHNIQNKVSIFWGAIVSIITILVSIYILVR